jgi:hypothetical protein
VAGGAGTAEKSSIAATVPRAVKYVGGLLTRERLSHILSDKGFRSNPYSLSGAHLEDAFVMDQRGGGWVVFYTERGIEFGLTEHSSEDAACRDLLNRLYRYSGYRDR